ncbi:MAG: pyridoxamine 5'-phosphate oxidase family protein [Bacillus sp. (in: firmicutes)]
MKKQDKLTTELIELLQGEKIVSLVTTNAETGLPNLSMISWVLAEPSGERVHFAIGHKASTVDNIESNPNVILGIMGAGSCFSIKGIGEVSDIIEKTMKLRVVTVEVESVEDVMFYGGKVTTEPQYEKTYKKELAEKLDSEVYEVLREAFERVTITN